MGQNPYVGLILPPWISTAHRTWQSSSVYIYLVSGASRTLLSCWLQPELRKNCWSPAQRTALHHTLPPLCAGPGTGREGGRTRRSTPAISLGPPCRAMLGGASRQHSSAFMGCNNFSWGLSIGSHVLFIQIAFLHSRNLHSSLH